MTTHERFRLFLSTMEVHGRQVPHCRWVSVTYDSLVTDDTNTDVPIEDFGMFWLTDHEVTPEAAFEFFMARLREQDGV